jgi:8-oxo-dGTP pyrophosphatase MutT (NUDIX family)
VLDFGKAQLNLKNLIMSDKLEKKDASKEDLSLDSRMKESREYRERIKRLNGANVIYENELGDILFGKSAFPSRTDGKYRYMLPGGGIDRGETPRHAAATELMEETGIHLYENENDIELVGIMMQIVLGVAETNGVVFLYRANKHDGEPMPSTELSEFKYFTHQEIIDLAACPQKDVIGLGYLRMVCHYINWRQSGQQKPFEARLSDPVKISRFVDSPLISV